MGFFKALGYGGITAVIGLFIVFLGLTILIGAVYLMGYLFKQFTARKEARQKAEAEAAAQAAAAMAAPAEAPAAAPAAAIEAAVDDAQLIAVIAAAIAAFDNSGKSLVVRKVRRVSGWNSAARAEQVYRF